MKIIGVIPCRYQSSRFPGKPIALIAGQPMVLHVCKRAKMSRLVNHLLVATDDDRIMTVCRNNGIEVVLTSSEHPTGTDRVAEVAGKVLGDIFVNIQGDEPLIDPDSIDVVAKEIIQSEDLITNGYSIIRDSAEVRNENVVKVITSPENYALAFSRAPIPHSKDPKQIYKKQLGLYAFRREVVLKFPQLRRHELEISESVDMYRFLENGYRIKMVPVADDQSIPVDIPGDIARVEEILKRRG